MKKLNNPLELTIIGRGFMGMSLAWRLHHDFPKAKITVFYSIKKGECSQISSGLIHAFHGPKAQKHPLADQALKALASQCEEMKKAQLPSSSFPQPIELLRASWHEKQEALFKKRAHDYPNELSYLEIAPPVDTLKKPSLLIKKAWEVDASSYLSALQDYLEKEGVIFKHQDLDPETTLQRYKNSSNEKLFICSGYAAAPWLDSSWASKLTSTNGQLLIWPATKKLSSPSFCPHNARYYLLKKNNHYLCGATFEKEAPSHHPKITPALNELFDYAKPFIELTHAGPKPPYLTLNESDDSPIKVLAGIRGNSDRHLPLLGWSHQNICFASALGSKGLLLHAYISSRVSNMLKAHYSDSIDLKRAFALDYLRYPLNHSLI